MIFECFKLTMKGSRSEKGFALVSVIWLSALLASAAAVLATSTRLSLKSTANLVEAEVLEVAADGLFNLVGYALAQSVTRPVSSLPISLSGQPFSCRIDEKTTATVSIQHQNGLIDLNLSALSLLEHYFSTRLRDPALAKDLVEKIDRFREAGPQLDTDAALSAIKDGRTTAFLPKNEHFQIVDELDQVALLSIEQFKKLTAFLTVNSKQTIPVFDLAPAELKPVLNTLPGGLTAGQRINSSSQLPLSLRDRVKVTASSSNPSTNGRVFRSAVLEITGHPQRPFAVRSWRVLLEKPPGFPEVDRYDAPPCNILLAG